MEQKYQSSEKKYKAFHETYTLCAFSLAVSLMYPNRSNVGKRLIIFIVLSIFNGMQTFWFVIYTFKCLYALDIFNSARNMTLFVIIALYFMKTIYIIYVTEEFAKLIDTISQDLVKAHDLDDECKMLYDDHIKKGKVVEVAWLVTPLILGALFPLYPAICMTMESLKTDDFTRYMVHDMDLMFFEDIQYETPFFQCMFAYNCIQAIVLVASFSGLDGSFCITTIHLCLKLRLMVNKVQRAFITSNNYEHLQRTLKEAIRDHQDALEFYRQIQKVYGPWLFAVFLLTSFMISFNLYQLYLLKRLHPKYTMFGLLGIIHIYLPSYYASTLTKVGEDIPSELYAINWETRLDPSITRMLTFMIAQAQQPLFFTGSGLVVFNMQLFKSIIQASYSFFTLITAP